MLKVIDDLNSTVIVVNPKHTSQICPNVDILTKKIAVVRNFSAPTAVILTMLYRTVGNLRDMAETLRVSPYLLDRGVSIIFNPFINL